MKKEKKETPEIPEKPYKPDLRPFGENFKHVDGTPYYVNELGRLKTHKELSRVFTIIATILFGIFGVCEIGQCQAWPPNHKLSEYPEADHRRQAAAGIDLYVKPKTPEPKPDVKPDVKPDPRQADRKAFPQLYAGEASKGTIVIFGASWCVWCKIQQKAIPEGYRVLYVDIEDKHGPDWRGLMTKWKIIDNKIANREVPILPVTAVAVGGVPQVHWTGFKPWSAIEKLCEKAKKNEKKDDFRGDSGDVGRPLDYRQKCRRPKHRSRYRPRFGRWAGR